jgi:hypothetical protein
MKVIYIPTQRKSNTPNNENELVYIYIQISEHLKVTEIVKD